MATEKLRMPRASDRTVIDTFLEIRKKHGLVSLNGRCYGTAGTTNFNPDDPGPIWRLVLDRDSCLIREMHLDVGPCQVAYLRGHNESDHNKVDPFFDALHVSFGNVPIEPTMVVDIVSILMGRLGSVVPDRTVDSGESPQQQLIAIQNSVLEHLQRVAATVTENVASQAVEVQRQLFEGQKENARALAEAKAALEAEHAEALRSLSDREQAVAAKLNEIDDRTNTHARREIRANMLADIKQRIEKFGVSNETNWKRFPVTVAIACLGTFVACLVAFTLWELKTLVLSPDGSNANIRYWLWGRMILLSLAFGATILYYLRWTTAWADRHADAEFQLRQFHLDVNRASWVVESCLEWRRDSSNGVIPKELLVSMTRNLFADKPSDQAQVLHPADELASALLGSASKVSLRAGENEVQFDKPGKIPRSSVVRPST